MLRRGESGRELRKIQGFRRKGRGAVDAGRFEPACDAGMAPQERRGRTDTRVGLLLPERARWECASSTAAVRPDTDAGSEKVKQAWRDLFHGRVLTERVRWEGKEGVAMCPSCSRNPHDEAVVVRRAQYRAAWLLPCDGNRGFWRCSRGSGRTRVVGIIPASVG